MRNKKSDGKKRIGRKKGTALLKNLDSLQYDYDKYDLFRFGIPNHEPEHSAYKLAESTYDYYAPNFLNCIPRSKKTTNESNYSSILRSNLFNALEHYLKHAVKRGSGNFFKIFGKAIEHFYRIRLQPVHLAHTVLHAFKMSAKQEDWTMPKIREFWSEYFKKNPAENHISQIPDEKTLRKACKNLQIELVPQKRGRPKK